jgi:hypothetical protein
VLFPVQEHVDQRIAHRSRRFQRARMVPIRPDPSRPANSPVRAARDANRESAHPARQGRLVMRFDYQVDVVGLNREMHDAECRPRGRRQSPADLGKDTLSSQHVQTRAQRDMNRVPGPVVGARTMGHARSAAGWFPASAWPFSTPRRQRELRHRSVCANRHLDRAIICPLLRDARAWSNKNASTRRLMPPPAHSAARAQETACARRRLRTPPLAHAAACARRHLRTPPLAHAAPCARRRLRTPPPAHSAACACRRLRTPPPAHAAACALRPLRTPPPAHAAARARRRPRTPPLEPHSAASCRPPRTPPLEPKRPPAPAHSAACALRRLRTPPLEPRRRPAVGPAASGARQSARRQQAPAATGGAPAPTRLSPCWRRPQMIRGLTPCEPPASPGTQIAGLGAEEHAQPSRLGLGRVPLTRHTPCT